MEPAANATAYIVDDDAEVREALAWLLRSRRVLSEAYASAEAFELMLAERATAGLPQRQPCCLLLDVRMPGMSGLALFDNMVARGDTAGIPVIFLTGHADVPTAVATVKRGAFDFCEKPFSDNQLKLDIPSDISFATGRADIEANFRPVLDRFAEGLRNNPNAEVRIIGHTDSTGSDAINNPLSLDRAESTRNYLTARGVSGARIQVDGRGSREPIAGNDTAAGRARNRRVEIFMGERQG